MAVPDKDLGAQKAQNIDNKVNEKKQVLSDYDFLAANPNATFDDIMVNRKAQEAQNINDYYAQRQADLAAEYDDPLLGVSDEMLDTVPGQVLNTAASGIATGSSRLAEGVFNAPNVLANLLDARGLTDKDYANFGTARSKLQKSQELGSQLRSLQNSEGLDPTERDRAISNVRQEIANNVMTAEEEALFSEDDLNPLSSAILGSDSKYSRLMDIEARREILINPVQKLSQQVTDTFVNQRDSQELQEEAKKDWSTVDFQTGIDRIANGEAGGVLEVASALGETFGHIADNIQENPSGVATVFAESVPQMIFANVAAIPAATAMAIQISENARQEYVKLNGKEPTGEDLGMLLVASTASAFLETIASKVSLGTPFPTTGKIASLVMPPVRVAGTAAIEGATEFTQGSLEEYAYRQDIDDMTFNEAFLGAIVGTAGGGSLSVLSPQTGTGQAVATTLRGAVNVTKAAGKGAATLGSKLLGSANNTDIEEQAASQPDVTQTEDAPKEYEIKAVPATRVDIEESYNTPTVNAPETAEELTAVDQVIAPYKEVATEFQELASNITAESTPEEQNAFAEKAVQLLTMGNDLHTQAEASQDPVQLEVSNRILREGRMIDGITKALSLSQVEVDNINETMANSGKSQAEVEQDISNNLLGNLQSSAKRVLYSTVLPNNDTSVEVIQSVLDADTDNNNNVLTPVERQHLEATLTYKAAEEVALDVIGGTEGKFIGAQVHVDNFVKSIRSNDVANASKSLNRLNNLVTQQQAKLDAVTSAIAEVEQSGQRKELTEFPRLDRDGNATGEYTVVDGTSKKGINSAKSLARSITQSVSSFTTALDAANSVVTGSNNLTDSAMQMLAAVEPSETTSTQPEQSAEPAQETSEVESESETEAVSEPEPQERTRDDIVTDLRNALQNQDLQAAQALVNELEGRDSNPEPSTPAPEPNINEVTETASEEATETQEEATATSTVKQELANIISRTKEIQKEYTDVRNAPQDILEEMEVLQTIYQSLKDLDGSQEVPVQFQYVPPNKRGVIGQLDEEVMSLEDVATKTGGKNGTELTETTRIGRTKNKVKEFFSSTSRGALQKVNNLITSFGETSASAYVNKLSEYLDTSDLNVHDATLLHELKRFRDTFGGAYATAIESAYEKQNKNYLYNSPQMYLFQAGKPVPALIDAVSIAAFNHLAYDSRDTQFNDARTISRILGDSNRKGSDHLNSSHWTTLHDVGTSRLDMIDTLGREALGNLGIRADSDIPSNLQSKLVSDLGASIYTAMKEAGYIKESSVPNATMYNLAKQAGIDPARWSTVNKDNETIPRGGNTYFAVTVTESAFANKIQEEGGKSSKITRQLSDPTAQIDKTYIGKPPKARKTMQVKNEDQKVPGKMVREHNEIIKQAYYVNRSMMESFGNLGQEFFEKIMGKDFTPEGLGNVNVIESNEGRNLGVDREIQAYLDLLDQMVDDINQPIYFDYDFISNMRHQMRGEFNLQRSTFHRFMVGHKPSKVTFTPDGNSRYERYLKLAIAQGLDLKPDKNSNQTVIDKLDSIIETDANPVLKQGYLALMDMLKGNDFDSDVVLEAVNFAGEGVHSYKSLLTLAEYQLALETGSESIDTDIMLEIDGVTNGPFNGTVQNGLSDLNDSELNMLEMGGLYPRKDGITNHNEVVETNKNHDLYNHSAQVANGYVQTLMSTMLMHGSEGGLVANAVGVFAKYTKDLKTEYDQDTGSLQSIDLQRNYMKKGVTASGYGAGDASVKRGTLDSHIAEMYQVIHTNTIIMETADTNSEEYFEAQANADRVIDDINLLLMTPSARLNKEGEMYFTPSKQRQITTKAGSIVKRFKDFKLTPSQFNHIQTVYNPILGEAVAEGINTVFNGVKQRGTSITEMSATTFNLFNAEYTQRVQERTNELRESGELSQDDGLPQSELDAILVGLSNIAPLYKGNFATEGNYATYTMLAGTTLSKGSSRVSASVGSLRPEHMEQTYVTPGVRPIALTTIGSGDAAMNILSNQFMDNAPSLNVFDAKFYTIGNMAKGYQALNAGAFYANTEHDQFGQFVKMYKNSLLNHPVLSNPDIDVAAKDAYVFEHTGWETYESLLSSLSEYETTANVINGAKQAVTQQGSYGQMASLGSIPMKNNRIVSSGVKKANKRGNSAKMTFKDHADNLNNGTYIAQDYTYLVNPEVTITGKGVLDNLVQLMKRDDPLWNTFNKKIYSVIKKNLPDDLEVRYVHSLDQVEGITNPEQRIAAYDGQNVYIRNNAYNETTLPHELIHAVTSHVVFEYYDGNKVTAAQKAAIKRVERLVESLRKDIDNIPASLAQAVGEADMSVAVNEVMAYGLTDPDAIQYLLNTNTSRMRKVVQAILKAVNDLLGTNLQPNDYVALVANFSEIAAKHQKGVLPTEGTQVLNQTVTLNTASIFDTLAQSTSVSVSPEHEARLRSALNNISAKAIAPLEARFKENLGTTTAEEQVFLDSLDPQVRANHNLMLTSGFNVSNQEAMVQQLYAEVARTTMNDLFYESKKVRDVFNAAKAQLSAKDFLENPDNPTRLDQQLSEQRYDALFNQKNFEGEGKNTYLANFVAMASTNEMVMRALGDVTVRPTKRENRGILDRIGGIVDTLLDYLSNYMSKAGNTATGAVKMRNLTKQLVAIKAKKQNLTDSLSTGFAKVDMRGNGFLLRNVNKITKAIRNNTLVGERSKIRTLGLVSVGLDGIFDGNTGNAFRTAIDRMVNMKASNEKLGFVGEMVNDLAGSMEHSKVIDDIRRRKQGVNESIRQDIKEVLPRMILDKFSTKLTKAQSEALTKAVLHTDLSSLIGTGYTLDQVINLMQDPVALQIEINNLISQLDTLEANPKWRTFFVNQVNNLGRFMVTGKNFLDYPLMNAYLIAKLAGTDAEVKEPSDDLVNLIDSLTTLVAMQQIDPVHREAFTELSNTEAEGIESLMSLHTGIKYTELKKVGSGYKYANTKGYVHEITNPHKAIAVVPEADIKKYKNKGYKVLRDFDKAPIDNSGKRVIMVSEDAGNAVFLQGAMSTIETMISGVNPTTGKPTNGAMPYYGMHSAQWIDDHNTVLKDKAFGDVDFSKTRNTLIPSFNSEGEVNGYRYALDNDTKDSLLDRDNRVEHVLSAWQSRNDEEVRSTTLNNELVRSLADIYRKAPVETRKDFIRVSPDSKHEDIKRLWGLIPDYTKTSIRATNGGNFLYVHRNDLNNVLGFHKTSVGDLWNVPKKDLNALQKTFRQVAENTLPKGSMKYLLRGERGIQELVQEAKDFIVVKSIIVPAFNIVSNLAQLYLRGVPVKDIGRNSAKAVHAARDYKATLRELVGLQSGINLEPSAEARYATEQRIAGLKDALENNPIHPLVQAGLMPSVVDEMTQAEETYSYKAGLLEGVLQPFTDQIPSGVRDVGKEVLIMKDSKAYAFLSQSVELGDFTAKYTRYIDLTERRGMSKQDALDSVAVEFIDYGKLPSKGMQYLNDMGLANFFKYTIRIQAILLDIIRNSPMRVLLLLLAQGSIGEELATPFEASVISTDFGAKTGLLDLLSGFFIHPAMSPL